MWRWPTVAAKKDKNAKVKGKVFSLHSKLIALAAEKWSDPNQNTALADAIHAAKKDDVTLDVIDRAIKRGSGQDKDAKKVEEIFYEGYAPGGVGIIIRALTDNKNRTAPSIRHILSAFWWNLWETGSVSSFLFTFLGKISLSHIQNTEEFEEALLETEASDYEISHDEATVWTKREDLAGTKQILESKGFTIEDSGFAYRPTNYTPVTEFDTALKIYKLFEELEEDEDVETFWNNADISDELWEEVATFASEKKFRT